MAKLQVKAGQLTGTNACYRRRGREINFETEKSEPYLLSVIVGEAIRIYVLGITGGAPVLPLNEFVKDRFKDIPYDIPEAKDMAIKQMVFLLKRWMNYDARPYRPEPQKLVSCFNVDVLIAPTLVYEDDDVVECVLVKYSKPKITMTSTSAGKGARTYLPLYALLQYGKTLVYPGQKKTVKATVMYLKRDDDKPAEGTFKTEFTEETGAKNVISLTEEEYVGGSTAMSAIDKAFESQFDEYFSGKLECSPEDCEHCDFNCVCNYNRAPVRLEEKTKKMLHFDDIVLSSSQAKVVSHKKGAILVNAGAGAGKTLCVAMHVVKLLMSGKKPEQILLITFTNNGAKEMLERVQYFVDDLGLSVDISKMRITTFNGFDNDILAKEYERFGFTEAPSLIEPEENAEIISKVLSENPVPGLDVLYADRKATKNSISMGAIPLATSAFKIIKSKNLSAGDGDILRQELGIYGEASVKDGRGFEELICAYNVYDRLMVSSNYITYDDQEYYRMRLIEMDPVYYDSLNISNIIVDEFQDTSDGQLDLIRVLMDTPTYEELMCVGDDSQAIYSFRDTTNANILYLEEKLDISVETVNLTDNFRSRPEIIELGNKINRLNPDRIDKDLVATRPAGGTVEINGFFESSEEFEFIAERVKDLVDKGENPTDIAVIVRTRSQLESIGTKLSALGIDWVSRAPMTMADNSRVRAASALIRAYATPEATELYMPYITCLCDGETFTLTDDEIKAYIEDLRAEIEALKALPSEECEAGMLMMLEAIAEDDEVYESFLDVIKRKKGMPNKVDYIRAYEKYGKEKTKTMDASYPGVQITTCHSAKGLEWKNVFLSLTGYDSEIYHKPAHSISSELSTEIQEARRLIFVGITRAKDNLCITGLWCLLKAGHVTEKVDLFFKEVHDENGTEYDPPFEEYAYRKAERAKERSALLRKRKLELGIIDEEKEKEKAEKKKASKKKAGEKAAPKAAGPATYTATA